MTLAQLKALKTGDYVFVQEPLSNECLIKPHVWKKCYLKNVNEKEGSIILSDNGCGFVIKFGDIFPFDKWNMSVYKSQQLEDLKTYSQSVYSNIDKWNSLLLQKKVSNA